ncbi:MAG: hypothetical protein IJD80_02460 [Oscillospiraceae bacterium]|nr:hypothetical protein [Oscillospiraceae bacterium]
MDYRVTFNLAAGGLGVTGRILVAVAILFAMKHFDRENSAEYTKGLKWLVVGGVLRILLTLLFAGIVRGMTLLSPAFFLDRFFW